MEAKPTADTAERLSEFLSQLTPAAAAELACGLERERLRGTGSLPYDLILSTIRPLLGRMKGPRPGAPDAMRHFCLPFEDLLVDARDPSLHRRQIARSSIEAVWAWLNEELLPDALPDMALGIVDHTLAGDHATLGSAVAAMHAACSSAIMTGLDASRRNSGRRIKLERRLGGEFVLHDAHIMAEALTVAPFMLNLRDTLPAQLDDFDDRQVALVSEIYEHARDAAPKEAIYVALAAMNRLAEPWQILRLARKLGSGVDDAALNRSGLAELGEAFIGELEDIASGLDAGRPGRTDLDDMMLRVARFAEISQGFIREIDIRRCSEWGHRILGARARLSTTIAEEMARFDTELAKTLPVSLIGTYGKNGPRRPDVTRAPDFARAEKASACLRFLHGVCRVAESIGVQADCKTVQQQIETYLVAYEDGLIDELRRAKGAELANGRAYLDLVIAFREMMGTQVAADTLRRRGRTVAAQAS
jgi:hypothetical protein